MTWWDPTLTLEEVQATAAKLLEHEDAYLRRADSASSSAQRDELLQTAEWFRQTREQFDERMSFLKTQDDLASLKLS